MYFVDMKSVFSEGFLWCDVFMGLYLHSTVDSFRLVLHLQVTQWQALGNTRPGCKG